MRRHRTATRIATVKPWLSETERVTLRDGGRDEGIRGLSNCDAHGHVDFEGTERKKVKPCVVFRGSTSVTIILCWPLWEAGPQPWPHRPPKLGSSGEMVPTAGHGESPLARQRSLNQILLSPHHPRAPPLLRSSFLSLFSVGAWFIYFILAFL